MSEGVRVVPAADVVELILGEEKYLRRLARRLAPCEADADDLVQETLLRAYRARNTFQSGTSIRGWTRTILWNQFLGRVKQVQRRHTQTETDGGKPFAAIVDRRRLSSREGEDLFSLFELCEEIPDPLKRALERVPECYRTPLMMSAFAGLTCKEIGKKLGVPAGTIMSRLHRARASILSRLTPEQRRELNPGRILSALSAVPGAAEEVRRRPLS